MLDAGLAHARRTSLLRSCKCMLDCGASTPWRLNLGAPKEMLLIWTFHLTTTVWFKLMSVPRNQRSQSQTLLQDLCRPCLIHRCCTQWFQLFLAWGPKVYPKSSIFQLLSERQDLASLAPSQAPSQAPSLLLPCQLQSLTNQSLMPTEKQPWPVQLLLMHWELLSTFGMISSSSLPVIGSEKLRSLGNRRAGNLSEVNFWF